MAALDISKGWGYFFVAHQAFAAPSTDTVHIGIKWLKPRVLHYGEYVIIFKDKASAWFTKTFAIFSFNDMVSNYVLSVTSRAGNTPRLM